MTYRNARTLDNYSAFDYKDTFDPLKSPAILPSWVGDHGRRLHAYALLQSYYSNSARFWLDDAEVQQNRREYGDAFILVETALASLLGDKQKVVVDGTLGEEDDENANGVQEALDEWLENEKFVLKMIESERQSCKYGDSIFVLAPDDKKKRPRLHVYDPGFYFPVFDPLQREGSEDFPNKVHIAWEFTMKVDGEDETFVRRITWELVEVPTLYTPSYADTPTNMNCLYTDAYWRLDEVGQDMTVAWGRTAQLITEPTMMNIDFIPVVHVPNAVSLQQHFGTSVLSPVMQIIDDIQGTDTDLQSAAATTGTPPIAVTGRGQSQNVESYGPGLIFYVGDGAANILDTSNSLDALLKLKDALLERLSVNSRTPEALLGRVKPNEVPSGISMTLSFAPHTGMIKEMRLVRKEKYRLLFKFWARLAGIANAPEIDLVLGSFLPADKQETMTEVVQLLGAKAISLETAIRMLMDTGYPIEDWVEEISRIQSNDLEAASAIVGLTGDPNTGLKRLGLPTIDVNDNPLDANNDPNA